jgi:calcium-dependent protein kinase
MGNICCDRKAIITKQNQPNQVYAIKLKNPIYRRRSSIFKEHITKSTNYKDKYEFISEIGEGSYGIVGLYCDKTYPDLKYAIKTLKKDLLEANKIICLIDEVKILRSIDHPNIVKYFETYEEDTKIHIVTEYIPGENMDQLIKLKNKILKEDEILGFTFYILKALSFLHRMNIIHRDIKPANILLSNESDISSLKLIDFGLSNLEKKKEKYRVGSPYFMAPEMIYGNYSSLSDMWSLGVVLYFFVTNKLPFKGREIKDIYKNIKSGKYDKEILLEGNLDTDLIKFIEKLLIVDESKRLNSDEAFEDPWIMKYLAKIELNTGSTLSINEKIIGSLRSFPKNNILQKEILFYLAKISNEEELVSLRKAFEKLDYDNKGVLEYNHINKLFIDQKIKITEVIKIYLYII